MFNMMGYGFGPLAGLGIGFGFIFMILFWAVVIWVIITLIRWFSHREHQHYSQEKTPLDILKERYAKGEINKQEFEEKKKDLT